MDHKKGTHGEECANCAAASGAVLKICSKCRLVAYCSQACQLQHWKDGGHKHFCLTPHERTKLSTASMEDPKKKKKKKNETSDCAICSDELISLCASTLPCGHGFHKQCLKNLHDFGMSQACPLCRAPLPPRETPDSRGLRDRLFVHFCSFFGLC